MKVRFTSEVLRTFRLLRRRDLIDEVQHALEQAVQVSKPEEIPGFKWLTGYQNYARIRVQDYRFIVAVDGQTIRFLRLRHRSRVYQERP